MNVAIRDTLMTVETFLDWCPDGEKWELIGGIPWRMMTEGGLHEQVKTNVTVAIGRRLTPPSPCRPGVDGRQVRVDDVTSYRPDVHIDCAPPPTAMQALIDRPTVIFEVSVSTLDHDKLHKRANYFRNPHVEHVVVIDATARRVHHFRRNSATETVLEGDDTLALDGAVALDIPVAEFFHFLT